MGTFIQQFNPLTGKYEWCIKGSQDKAEEYDLRQEVARSSYGSMLHDVDRNEKYYAALRFHINRLHADGKLVHVLDVGTGTGLLSMMALRCGADFVTACEAFQPMAQCAKYVTKDNLSSEEMSRFNLVEKRSTEMVLGVDIKERANLLVAEIFDTELIGEGALSSFRHAAEHFLVNDAVVIPSLARLYVQPIQSVFLRQHFELSWDSHGSHRLPRVPQIIRNCRGCFSAFDLQASQLVPEDDFIPLGPVTLLRQFKFYPPEAISLEHSEEVNLHIEKSGRIDAFVVWWDLDMVENEDLIIDCCPNWHDVNAYHWRDHWMQAVYFPRCGDQDNRLHVTQGTEVALEFHHDEYSVWMDVKESCTSSGLLSIFSEPPSCHCTLHTTTSRQRIASLNSMDNITFFDEVAKELCKMGVKRALFIGSFSYFPFALCTSGGIETYIYSSDRRCQRLNERLCEENPELSSRLHIYTIVDEDGEDDEYKQAFHSVDAIVAEPYFEESPVEWINVNFIYRLPSTFPTMEQISPYKLRIQCIPMQFSHLHLIRQPIENCAGFRLNAFGELVDQCIRLVDAEVESHALWEYEGICLSSPYTVLEVDLRKLLAYHTKMCDLVSTTRKTAIQIAHPGTLNALVYWCEWVHVGEMVKSAGPIKTCSPGQSPVWRRSTSQGVQFITHPRIVEFGNTTELASTFSGENLQFTFSLLKITS